MFPTILRHSVALAALFAFTQLAVVAALPPLGSAERWSDAQLVVAGVVEEITSREIPVSNGINREYSATIQIERVLKGETPDTARLTATYWRPAARPEAWVGDGGQRAPIAVGERMLFFLRRIAPAAISKTEPELATSTAPTLASVPVPPSMQYRLLSPNGAERLLDFSTKDLTFSYPEDWTVDTTPIPAGVKVSVWPPEWERKSFGVVIEIRPVGPISPAGTDRTNDTETPRTPQKALARLITETLEAPEGTVHEERGKTKTEEESGKSAKGEECDESSTERIGMAMPEVAVAAATAETTEATAPAEAVVSWKDDPRQKLAFKDDVRFRKIHDRLYHIVYSSSTADFAAFHDDALTIINSIRARAQQTPSFLTTLAGRWINTNGIFRGNLTITEYGTYTWHDPDDFWKPRSTGRIEATENEIRFIPTASTTTTQTVQTVETANTDPIICHYEYDPNALVKLTLTPTSGKNPLPYFFSN